MAVFNGAFPVLPGKVEVSQLAKKRWVRAARVTTSREAGRDYSRDVVASGESGRKRIRAGVVREPHPEQSFAELAQDSSDFGVWLRAQVKEVSGVDLTAPPAGGGPELVLDWKA